MVTPALRTNFQPVDQVQASPSVNLNNGNGTTVGDLMIAFVATSSSYTVTPPSGWAQVGTVTNSANYKLSVFSRTATSTDVSSGNYTFTVTNNGASFAVAAVVLSYQGASAVDVSGVNGSNASATSWAAPVVTTTSGNELIVNFWSGSNGASITVPDTSRLTYNTNTSALILGLSDRAQPSAGNTTAAVATSSSSATWVAATVALSGNRPPNAPTLNSPTGNMTIDRTSTQRFAWTSSDSDVGDSQSAYDLRYATQSGSYPTTPQYSGTTPNNYLDIPGGTFAAGSYQWQVRTYDSQGVVGPWSSAAFFSAQTPPAGPTITYPTSGGTVNSPDHIDWSYTSEQSYQVQRVADNAGAIDVTTVYYDTGEVLDPNNTIRTQQLTFPTNNRYEWLRLRIKQGNQWSAWVQIRVQVSYSPPPTPTFTVTVGQPNVAAMRVAVTNPAPSGSSPAATSNLIEASRDGGSTVEWSRGAVQTVNPNAVVPFWTPLSGATYSFRVTAKADNGTTSTTGWITPGLATAYGEGAYGAGPYGGAAA